MQEVMFYTIILAALAAELLVFKYIEDKLIGKSSAKRAKPIIKREKPSDTPYTIIEQVTINTSGSDFESATKEA